MEDPARVQRIRQLVVVRITLEHRANAGNFPIGDLPRPSTPTEDATVYYQINYTLTDVPPGEGYTPFSTPFLGLSQVLRPDGLYRAQQRFGMYRWHIMDPIRLEADLRVTIQALGWRSGRRYRLLQDDIASTAFY